MNIECVQVITIGFQRFKGIVLDEAPLQQQREIVSLFKAKTIGKDVSLKKFLGALLEMKTDLVLIFLLLCKDYLRELKVVFGFSKPLVNDAPVNHKALCPLGG